LLDEFFRSCFRKKLYETVEPLLTDLDQWLNHCNYEPSHRGCRNMGRRSAETIEMGKRRREELMNEAA
jgi:hypothetical protein